MPLASGDTAQPMVALHGAHGEPLLMDTSGLSSSPTRFAGQALAPERPLTRQNPSIRLPLGYYVQNRWRRLLFGPLSEATADGRRTPTQPVRRLRPPSRCFGRPFTTARCQAFVPSGRLWTSERAAVHFRNDSGQADTSYPGFGIQRGPKAGFRPWDPGARKKA